jgi:uncharacterized protein (TIGR02147 family)
MTSWVPDIFEFTNFRQWLAAYYEAAKVHQPSFSYRWFARRAGFTSPNFLKLVIDGQRNIGADSVEKFVEALRLSEAEGLFFADLVFFAQAETADEKNAAWERIAASRRFRKARRIDSAYFEYLSHWYYPAIREMAARPDFVEDPVWIATELLPAIRPAEAKRALALLLELGFLVRDANGRLQRGDPSVTTGHEVRSLAIGNFHRQMLVRAADSIERVDRSERDISALTVCVARGRVAELKARIHAFRESLLHLCDEDTAPDVVYQINFQLFPLTRTRKRNVS